MAEKRGRGRPPASPEPPTRTTTMNDLNNSLQNNYLSLSKKQYHRCSCWSCSLVGNKLIEIQYSKGDSVLIEDRSNRIFNPMLERCQN